MTNTTRYATTSTSFRTDILPWRLYQKGKQLAWDPADIDFTADANDWHTQDDRLLRGVARLAATFMAGEEAVTLDIVPLIRAVSEEGRTEETLFLTTFLGDEAKHAELFRRWFDAIGQTDPLDHLLTEEYRHIIGVDLPRAMTRLDTDRSPEAFLDASLTYNHFVERVLAMTGYYAWQRIFTMLNLFPGMRQGVGLIQRDERRHLAYGTYLCRRIVAEHPEAWAFVEQRMGELREQGLSFVDDIASAFFEEFGVDALADPGMKTLADQTVAEFRQYGEQQLARRLHAIEVARGSTVDDIERGTVEEELEADLEQV
ncbi:MAG TPA: R2-like ligand-binding oxidase [Actinomycetota bacterium]|jgi:ribonucleoside-diphosphate reductase beta chain|nr:R2-like ligand-binding oxidase [Actinomycetota bacterium]